MLKPREVILNNLTKEKESKQSKSKELEVRTSLVTAQIVC